MRYFKLVMTFMATLVFLISQANAATPAEDLRSMYRGNITPMIPLLSQDIEWTMMGDPEVVPLAGTYTGFRSVMLHWVKFLKEVKIKSIDLDYVFTDELNHLHVMFTMKGKIRKTRNEFDMQFAHLLTLNDSGQIVENKVFYDTTTWWAAFNRYDDVKDRRVGQTYEHLNAGTLGASTPVVVAAYEAFAQGDVMGAIAQFNPTDFLWILKGDAFGDSLGTPGQGIPHVGRWEGIGNPFEDPYPTTGFLGFLTAMNGSFEYVMPETPDGELPFQVKYLGSNGNFASAHVQEIQRHLGTQQIARIQIYHFFVLDEQQKVMLGFSFNDNAALCKVDPNCAFYADMQ